MQGCVCTCCAMHTHNLPTNKASCTCQGTWKHEAGSCRAPSGSDGKLESVLLTLGIFVECCARFGQGRTWFYVQPQESSPRKACRFSVSISVVVREVQVSVGLRVQRRQYKCNLPPVRSLFLCPGPSSTVEDIPCSLATERQGENHKRRHREEE